MEDGILLFKMMEKKRITMKKEDLNYIFWVLDHFTDYMAHDDRIDHGWNILKEARNWDMEKKTRLYSATGRLKYILNNWEKASHNQTEK